MRLCNCLFELQCNSDELVDLLEEQIDVASRNAPIHRNLVVEFDGGSLVHCFSRHLILFTDHVV